MQNNCCFWNCYGLSVFIWALTFSTINAMHNQKIWSNLNRLCFFLKFAPINFSAIEAMKIRIWTFCTILACTAKLAPKLPLPHWTFESWTNSRLVTITPDCPELSFRVCSQSVYTLTFLPIKLVFLSNTN